MYIFSVIQIKSLFEYNIGRSNNLLELVSHNNNIIRSKKCIVNDRKYAKHGFSQNLLLNDSYHAVRNDGIVVRTTRSNRRCK